MAPIKPITLTQIKLTALELETKLAHYVIELFNIEEVFVWTDSEICLQMSKTVIGKSKPEDPLSHLNMC